VLEQKNSKLAILFSQLSGVDINDLDVFKPNYWLVGGGYCIDVPSASEIRPKLTHRHNNDRAKT
jgi:hypothetical protein